MDRDLVWIAEAATEVNRAPITLRRWIKRGLLKGYKKEFDHRLYVDRVQLLELVRNPPVHER